MNLKLYSFLDGFVMVVDGLIQILSLGHIHTGWNFRFAMWQSKKYAQKVMKERGQNES